MLTIALAGLMGAGALAAFWMWMFRDMANNPALPRCYVSITHGRDDRWDWTFAFVALTLITAGVYSSTVYRGR